MEVVVGKILKNTLYLDRYKWYICVLLVAYGLLFFKCSYNKRSFHLQKIIIIIIIIFAFFVNFIF